MIMGLRFIRRQLPTDPKNIGQKRYAMILQQCNRTFSEVVDENGARAGSTFVDEWEDVPMVIEEPRQDVVAPNSGG